jgi:hypothetical protein
MATAASNTIKVHTMFAEEALEVLENELQLGSLVWRSLESEFSKEPNGYKIGQTIKVKKPPKYTASSGAAITAFQDTAEEEVSLTVDQRFKVSVQFSTQELTQDLTSFKERVVKPAVVPLSDKIDDSIAGLHVDLHHAVGTAGTTMATFEDMQKIDTRFVQIAAPPDKRCSIFDPDNYAGLVSGAKSHFEQSIVKDALKNNYLGRYSNIDTFRAVHVKTHTNGAWAGTPLVDGAAQTGATLNVKDFTALTTMKDGDIFTIADVYDVNPINKQTYNYLKQFVVTADAAADGSGDVALTISPSIVTSGAKQNVSAGPADGAAITLDSGTGSGTHQANFAFTKQTFALACVPLVDAGGGAISTTVSSKAAGLSIRMVEYYDGDNDYTNTRLDILYGVATMYAETGIKVYG